MCDSQKAKPLEEVQLAIEPKRKTTTESAPDETNLNEELARFVMSVTKFAKIDRDAWPEIIRAAGETYSDVTDINVALIRAACVMYHVAGLASLSGCPLHYQSDIVHKMFDMIEICVSYATFPEERLIKLTFAAAIRAGFGSRSAANEQARA